MAKISVFVFYPDKKSGEDFATKKTGVSKEEKIFPDYLACF
jgi:hypothetical protein